MTELIFLHLFETILVLLSCKDWNENKKVSDSISAHDGLVLKNVTQELKKSFNQFWWTQLSNSQAEEGGWSVYYPLPPGATSLFWSTLEMLLMIKTMKSGLSCSYEAICLREGEKANSGVRQVGLRLILRHILQLMMMIMAILTNWQPLLPRHIRTCGVSTFYLTQLL